MPISRLSLIVPFPLLACSLGGNNLTNDGKAMSGLLQLVEVLPQTKIQSLECAHASKVIACASAPVDTAPFLGSLANTSLCGDSFRGTYPTEGITKLCEALKGSVVTSLKCATTLECFLLCQRPLTRLSLTPTPYTSVYFCVSTP